jgi:hypothetical protein
VRGHRSRGGAPGLVEDVADARQEQAYGSAGKGEVDRFFAIAGKLTDPGVGR